MCVFKSCHRFLDMNNKTRFKANVNVIKTIGLMCFLENLFEPFQITLLTADICSEVLTDHREHGGELKGLGFLRDALNRSTGEVFPHQC